MPRVAVPDPRAAGTVRLIAQGTRAVVRLDDERIVTICQERVAPLVPLDRVFAVGMRVEGELDASGTELLLELETPSMAVLDAMFPDGVVAPALVTKVGELGGELALHPDVLIRISRRDVSCNPKDRIDRLLEVGETVAARVSRHSDGSLRLGMLDIDDDEPIQPALRLLPGGPEWLVFPEEDQPTEEPAPEAIEGPTVEALEPLNPRTALRDALLALETERARSARLERELAAAQATTPEAMREVRLGLGEALRERDRFAGKLRTLRATVGELRKATRDAVKPTTPRGRRDRFGDAESWIRHELHLAWIERLPHAERAEFPLRTDYVLGAGFAASLEVLDDGRLDKALRAGVDVLTGRAATMPARAVHALRTSESGGAPDVTRADGAVCLRCAIENDTASARRLHWWKRKDGGIELSRVVLHDDMTP